MKIIIKKLSSSSKEDMCLLQDDKGISYAIFHEDMLWDREGTDQRRVYDAIRNGETITATIVFEK